jgi:hypothetical protein
MFRNKVTVASSIAARITLSEDFVGINVTCKFPVTNKKAASKKGAALKFQHF